MHDLDVEITDPEDFSIAKQSVEIRSVYPEIVEREHRAEDLLHVADMLADPDHGVGLRLDEGCRRQMIGMRMRFQHHDNPPTVLAGCGDDALGGARIDLAARQVEIKHRVDHHCLDRDGVRDEITDRVGGLVEKGFDNRLDRHRYLLWLDNIFRFTKLAMTNGVARCQNRRWILPCLKRRPERSPSN
jgi:hypothetical protein